MPDFHADPSAHYWDNKYWIYPSTDEPGSTSWAEMKQWHCYSSTDLKEWTNEGKIFSLEDISWAEDCAFAPDAVKWKGKYYFVFPAGKNIGIAVSDKPNGPFKDALSTNDIILTLVWKSKEGANANGLVNSFNFQKNCEIENYWHDDSIESNFKCPICGDPPCCCSAILYYYIPSQKNELQIDLQAV